MSDERNRRYGRLTFTRQVDETIEIGEDIVVLVSEIDRNRTKLTVVAPPEVRIDRGDIGNQKRSAGTLPPQDPNLAEAVNRSRTNRRSRYTK